MEKKSLDYKEQLATNRASKPTTINKIRAQLLATYANKEEGDKFSPFVVDVLRKTKKDTNLYQIFVKNIEPNKQGLFKTWKILTFIRKNTWLYSYIYEGAPLPDASTVIQVKNPVRKPSNKETTKITKKAA